MKNIVIFDDYNEVDLKPSDLLHQYIELTREDVNRWLIKDQPLQSCPCTACGSLSICSEFKKFELPYKECSSCHTLYISPRPNDAVINNYYRQAKSVVFWRKEFLRRTHQKRKEKIIKPRFQWILDSTQEFFPSAENFVDLNTNQYGYIEEMILTRQFRRKTLIDPFVQPQHVVAHLTDAVNIISEPWWKVGLKEEIDVVSIFEVGDRTANVDELFSKLRQILKPRGLIFMTAILISGFDLQTLWEKSENLYPPDRLNVFSIEGLKILFERHGLECLELSTPGILDVEIVAKALREDPTIKLPQFIEYMLNNRSDGIKKAFQEFLQSSLLSSYGRILLRKK